MNTPQIESRPGQPYVAIAGRVAMDGIPEIADRFPELFGFLAGQHISPVGPPFLRYAAFSRSGTVDLEAGAPVATIPDLALPPGYRIGDLPGGRFVTAIHQGRFDRLAEATAALLEWATTNELRFATSQNEAGDETWDARLEIYRTDPRAEPDPALWITELAFLLSE